MSTFEPSYEQLDQLRRWPDPLPILAQLVFVDVAMLLHFIREGDLIQRDLALRAFYEDLRHVAELETLATERGLRSPTFDYVAHERDF